MEKMMGFQQAAAVLPPRLRQMAMDLPQRVQGSAEEIRLRSGGGAAVLCAGEELPLGDGAVTAQDLSQTLELASRFSVHAVMDQLRRGYLTLAGGHRLGLCGTAVMREGEIYTFRHLSSINIRVARQVKGVARPLLEQLTCDNRLCSTLIFAPPGLGKTTLLRDFIRAVSAGEGTAPMRIGLADERGEVAALWDGAPQLDVGPRTDVIEGCPKAEGMLLLLRSMNPQVLAADEITAPEDISALTQAAGCGAALLATAHGGGREDLTRRALYRELLSAGVFQRLLTIVQKGTQRHYQVEVLK